MTTSAPASARAAVSAPSRTLVRLALAAIAVNVAIVVTGGIVRVTGSGLGCPEWPSCDGTRVVPQAGAEQGWHAAVEFGNRLMTFVVLAVVVGLYVRLRRELPGSRAQRWSGWLIVGVLGQGVLGGITVRLDLNPVTVAVHFLASMALLVLAAAVHHLLTRSGGETAPGPRLRLIAVGILVGAAAVLIVGTVVTASGPHAGDPGTPRLGFDIRSVARAHTTAVWTTVLLTVVGLVAARREGADRLAHAFAVLLVVELLQGAVGYAQYLLGIPPALVALHLLGACLFWLAALRVGLLTFAPAPSLSPASFVPTS